jgi:hypothetical protein
MSEPFGAQRQPLDFTEDQATQRIFVPVAARGQAGPSVPERQMLPGELTGPFWRDLDGWEINEGYLESSGLVTTHGLAPVPPIDRAQAGISLYKRLYSGKGYHILITTEEIWHYNVATATWKSLTPRFNAGDCNVTNGSTTVTFSGSKAKLISRGHIQAGQMFRGFDVGDSDYYQIASVDSETKLTLTSAFAGTTSTGKDYQIKQTFRSGGAVFSRIFNNDLVVAYSSNVGDKIAAVVIVEAILREAPAPFVAIPALANVQLYKDGGSGAAVDVLEKMIHITGLEMHTDGRAIIATQSLDDLPNAGVVPSRLQYSSHISLFEWLDEPAGFVDLIGLDGSLGGLQRYGEQILVHFSDGIMTGFESGQTEPPLNYEITSLVDRGATHPRSIKQTPIGQIYAHFPVDATEGTPNVYVFDGAESRPIGDDIRDLLPAISTGPPNNGNVWAYVDKGKSAYHLFVTGHGLLGDETDEFVYYWAKDQWTHATRQEEWWGYDTDTDDLALRRISRSHATLWDYQYSNTGNEDEISGGGRLVRPRLSSEWLDARQPGFDKTWVGVLLWVEAQIGNNLEIRCSLRGRHGVSSATTEAITLVYPGVASVQQLYFSFDPFIAEAVQVQLTFDTDNTGASLPYIHHIGVDFAMIGQGEGSGAMTHSASV